MGCDCMGKGVGRVHCTVDGASCHAARPRVYDTPVALPISHRIGPATTEELPQVFALLAAHGLPSQGLEAVVDTLLVSRSRGQVIGCAALEVYGDAALLRSVAVDPGWQGRGLGKELVERAISTARLRHVTHVYLLTFSAAGYFERLGFTACERSEVPSAIQNSLEFTTLCPVTTPAMQKGPI